LPFHFAWLCCSGGILYTIYIISWFFFLNPENFFLAGSSSSRYIIIHYSICCRKIRTSPNRVSRTPSSSVYCPFWCLFCRCRGPPHKFPEDLLFPLVCLLYYYFPSPPDTGENIKICTRCICAVYTYRKNKIIIIMGK